MPTVRREKRFEVRIYTFDHAPRQVHVAKAGAIVRIDLATHTVTEMVGQTSDRYVKQAEQLVARSARKLLNPGREYMAPEVSSTDRERYARARARGRARAQDGSAVVNVRYDGDRDGFELLFRGGGTMAIPRKMIPGLERRPAAKLAAVRVSPPGDALWWPSLDVDVYVPGLVERAFGSRLFAAATGRRGGRRRSKAKTEAARANGATGGRPRKRATAP
jgi:Protein of unknown function (DUF2442)